MSLWIYKCNSENPNRAHGEWADFFDGASASVNGTMRWGGPDVTSQPASTKLAESIQVGQMVLCWQRWTGGFKQAPPSGVKAAAVGIVEFAGWTSEGRWLFRAEERFSDPVPLLKWSKTNPTIGGIFSFPRRMGTLIDLSVAEEQEVLRICSEQLGKKIRVTQPDSTSHHEGDPQSVLVLQAALDKVRSRASGDPGRRANAAALQAARAWLLGKSLAAEVDELRFESEDGPVPAPGLPKLLERLEKDLRDVCDLSDRVAILVRDPDQTAELKARIEVDADAAEEGADEAELVTRRIAQLAFGVSSRLGPNGRIERLDRAAVAVLHPPPGTGRAVGLVDDGIELLTRHAPELPIELGGVICRMLVDRNVTVRFGEVELRVGSDETFHLSSPDGERAWDSPVEVSDPANATAKALKSLAMSTKQIREAAVAEWLDVST